MKNKHPLRKRVYHVPMPNKGWESRMTSYIFSYDQHQRNLLVSWIEQFTNLFYRYKLLAPSLAVMILAVSYFFQPIHLYNESLAANEEAIQYFEEVTQIADYEIDFTEEISAWIIDY